MRNLVYKLAVLLSLMMSFGLMRCNIAYASDYVELDTSDFSYYSFVDEKFSEQYGADYADKFPYAIVFTQTYDDGGFYGGVKTYCVRSTKPLKYDDVEEMVCGSTGSVTVHAVCSFSKTYGSQTTVLGDGGLYVLPSMPYSSNYEIKDSTGTVVFQGAPLQTKLAQITERATKNNSPMSQVVFLVPLLISLVVSFLALRKVLAFLSKVLRQS